MKHHDNTVIMYITNQQRARIFVKEILIKALDETTENIQFNSRILWKTDIYVINGSLWSLSKK